MIIVSYTINDYTQNGNEIPRNISCLTDLGSSDSLDAYNEIVYESIIGAPEPGWIGNPPPIEAKLSWDICNTALLPTPQPTSICEGDPNIIPCRCLETEFECVPDGGRTDCEWDSDTQRCRSIIPTLEPTLEPTPEPTSRPTPEPTALSPTIGLPTPEPIQELKCDDTDSGEWPPIQSDTIYRIDVSDVNNLIGLEFNACNSEFDTVLELYEDINLSILIDDNDDGCGLSLGQSLLIINPIRSGIYYLNFISKNGFGVEGRYEIQVVCQLISSTTPQPLPTTPQPTAFPTLYPTVVPTLQPTPISIDCGDTQRSFYPLRDIFFRFDLSFNAQSVTFDACRSDFDTILELYNSSGTLIASDDDGCTVSPDFGQSLLIVPDLPSNVYLLKLVSKEGIGIEGIYQISIICEQTPQPLPTPPLPTPIPTLPTPLPTTTTQQPLPTSPTSLPFPTPFPTTPPTTDVIICGDTISDFWRLRPVYLGLDVTSNNNLETVIISLCGNVTNFDTTLELYDSTGTILLDQDDNGCGGINNNQSQIIGNNLPSNLYIIKIGSAEGIAIEGEWELRIICSTLPPSPNTPQPTTPSPTTLSPTTPSPTISLPTFPTIPTSPTLPTFPTITIQPTHDIEPTLPTVPTIPSEPPISIRPTSRIPTQPTVPTITVPTITFKPTPDIKPTSPTSPTIQIPSAPSVSVKPTQEIPTKPTYWWNTPKPNGENECDYYDTNWELNYLYSYVLSIFI